MKQNNIGDIRFYQFVDTQKEYFVTEAYKSMRTNIMFTLANKENRTMVFTSSVPGEGKSSVCANFALILAQTGARVLIIDADMRKPTIHKIMNRPNKQGLSNVLGEFYALAQSINDTEYPKLFYISAGTNPPNPTELLNSTKMEKMLDELQKEFDYILIDSPPINLVTDALLLARYAAGIVFVVRQDYSAHDEIEKALQSIEFIEANLLGMVLFDAKMHGHYDSKYKYSKYKYGKYGKYRYASYYGATEVSSVEEEESVANVQG